MYKPSFGLVIVQNEAMSGCELLLSEAVYDPRKCQILSSGGLAIEDHRWAED